MSDPDYRLLLGRALWLEYMTLAWNVVSAVAVTLAAVAAHSVALAGFGLDSLIEILASLTVVWQLKGISHQREQRALRIIGLALFAVAIYIAAQSVHVLVAGARPAASMLGMIWLSLTVAAMLLLASAKKRIGRQLSNPVLLSEANVTLIDAYLAMAVLVGIVLNATAGLWWADPIAALVIVYYGVREGIRVTKRAGGDMSGA
ncbi:MAG TPA: cation transporter [Terriglobales bacterium]|nr:cation transporter [Terriglobales bacterium]